MKIVVFYILTFCLAGILNAQTSNVVLSSEKGERFTVILNGEKQNKTPVSKLKLNKLDAPVYKVKIVFATAKLKPILKTLTLEPGFESHYSIKKVGKSHKIVFVNADLIPEDDKQNIFSAADTTSGKGSVRIDPSPKVRTAFIPGYMGQIGCPRPIGAVEFATVKKNINSKNTEEEKQQIAKQAINTNCLLSTQVKELLMLFSFEKTRIEFAKIAYTHTYDIGNYNKVADALMFEASVKELNAYLSEKTR